MFVKSFPLIQTTKSRRVELDVAIIKLIIGLLTLISGLNLTQSLPKLVCGTRTYVLPNSKLKPLAANQTQTQTCAPKSNPNLKLKPNTNLTTWT